MHRQDPFDGGKTRHLWMILTPAAVCAAVCIMVSAMQSASGYTSNLKTGNKLNLLWPVNCIMLTAVLYLSVWIFRLKRTLHILHKAAATDSLTKLYNRNFLELYLGNQIEAANLANQQVSVIMVDIDHFKTINDTYGHLVGDYALTLFAGSIQKCIRKTDLVARFGGDEFIAVLPATDSETAKAIAERIRHEVSETRVPPYNNVIIPSISCSVGISTYPVFCDSKDTLIMTSDIALYTAKQAGRNCTRIYEKKIAV